MSQGKRVLMEGLIVLVVGMMVAVLANLLSPRGLSLTRDYFPDGARPVSPPGTNATRIGVGTNSQSLPDPLVAHLRAKGLQVVESNRVVELFQDPRFAQERIVFVDARNEEHYQAGHIPGAWLFDHYHAENYLPSVLPACLVAEVVVVYCTGGNCEDSEFAAVILRDSAGVPAAKIFVYPGGITEWKALKLPVELGARKSGNLVKP